MYKHVDMLDLYNNGIGYEVIVIKRNKANGDVFYIRTDQLDEIDYNRMAGILRRRDAQNYEMWDLLSQITLGNGMNALEYFHQLVMIRTRSGELMRPNPRRAGMGGPSRTLDPRNASKVGKKYERDNVDSALNESSQEIGEGSEESPKPRRRRPGRPPKND